MTEERTLRKNQFRKKQTSSLRWTVLIMMDTLPYNVSGLMWIPLNTPQPLLSSVTLKLYLSILFIISRFYIYIILSSTRFSNSPFILYFSVFTIFLVLIFVSFYVYFFFVHLFNLLLFFYRSSLYHCY